MNKKLLLTVVILAAFALISSAAMAMAPLGTPTSDLKAGQFGVGVEYAYANSKIKIEGEGTSLRTNMFLAKLGYGIVDDWEGFVRLGFGNARAESFAGDYKFAWGWGTKYTFLKQDNVDWGVLFQMNWLRSKDSKAGVDTEMKPYDYVLALGPNFKVSEDLSIYGGPTLQFMRGKATAEFEGESISGNIKEKHVFGAYAGVQATLCPNTSWFGELQLPGFVSGYAIATGITWKF